jgi:glycosyltransferase involved in cell wall biosynthesis
VSFVIILFSLGLLIGGIGIFLIRRGRETDLKSISVTIVARDEEKILPQTLAALSRINYPPELYEIILVDDGSQDNTNQLFRSFADSRKNVEILTISREEKILPGKKQGLQKALEKARHEIFLMTDADCFVSENWLKDCSGYWDDKTKMLVGYAPEDYSQLLRQAPFSRKLFFLFRRFSQIVTAGSFAATIGLGLPFSCYGRNMAVSRELLLKAGGYHKIGKEPSGDDKQVLNLMLKQPGVIRYSPLRNVVTRPELERYRDQQKRRFGKVRMSTTFHFIMTLLIIGFYLYLPFRVFLWADYGSFAIFYLSAAAVWLLNLAKHKERFSLFDLLFIIVYPYYLIYYTVIGSKGDWRWKE